MREKVDAARTGEFLSALRKARSLTQEQVAEALCVSNKTISKWESGSGLPDITILPDLAEFYGITVDDLLAGQRLQTAQKGCDVRWKHWQRLYHQVDFRTAVIGLCMAVLPLVGLLLKAVFPKLSYGVIMGLAGADMVTMLICALAFLGLHGCDSWLEGLSELGAADLAAIAQLKLRQARFSALLFINILLYVWQVLPKRMWFHVLQNGMSLQGELQARIPTLALNCLLLLGLLLLFLLLHRKTPDLLDGRGRWLLGVEYGLCWLSQFLVLGLSLRAAFFVQQVKWSTRAAWKLVAQAEYFFSPLLLILVLTFTGYSLLQKEKS